MGRNCARDGRNATWARLWPKAFRHDRSRGNDLTAEGWSVMHVTWDQLIEEPLRTVARISQALACREPA